MLSVTLLLSLLPVAIAAAADGRSPTNLQFDFMRSPLRGVDRAGPYHLSWQAGAALVTSRLAPQAAQVASQIRVQQMLPGGGSLKTIYDSGLVPNVRPEYIVHELPLQTDRSYCWAVRTQSDGGVLTSWSSNFSFTTGIFAQAEWKARWIRGGTQMRRAFTVPPGFVARATIFVSACQYYTLTLDGQRVGKNHLDVGWCVTACRSHPLFCYSIWM